MEIKKCSNCNKNFNEKDYFQIGNPYTLSAWKRRKYCSHACLMEAQKRRNKLTYLLSNTEHNNKVQEINKIINGEIIITKANPMKSNQYFPDIKINNVCYEVELFRKVLHLKNKAIKWNKRDKHILVVTISEISKNLFDEVYFFDKKLIRIN